MKEKNQILVRLGATLRKTREAKGISQEKLAAIVGLHRNYVGQLERGEANISYLNLLKIAEAINLDLKDIF